MRRGAIVKSAKDGETEKLKRRIKRLEKENKRLKSELRTYESVFKTTSNFVKGSTEEVTLEKLIGAAKRGVGLKEIEETEDTPKCSNCSGTNINTISTTFGKLVLCKDCNNREVFRDKA